MLVISRDDFWASTSNKQLNFLQHIFTILKQHGRAAVVLPGNVLFFDRKPAQEKPWTERLWIYDLRTNQHFTLKERPLERADLDDFLACYFGQCNSGKSGSGVSPLKRENQSRDGSATLNRFNRRETERFKSFPYDELVKRDKANLDIFWLKDEAPEASANLPEPGVIDQEIADDLEAALE